MLLGDGAGGFGEAPGSPFAVGVWPESVAVGDFNGDGKLDLATTNSTSRNVTVLLANGTGGFGAAPGSPFAGGTYPRSVAAGDFNRDGKLDLAIGVDGEQKVRVLLNTALQSITVSPAPATVAAGGTRQFTATGRYPDSSTLDLTSFVTWSSSNAGLASISNSPGTQGLATGVSAGGPVTITAALGGIIGTAFLTVTAAVP